VGFQKASYSRQRTILCTSDSRESLAKMIFLPAVLGNLLRHAILFFEQCGEDVFHFSQKFSIRPNIRVEPVIACLFLTFHVYERSRCQRSLPNFTVIVLVNILLRLENFCRLSRVEESRWNIILGRAFFYLPRRGDSIDWSFRFSSIPWLQRSTLLPCGSASQR
jgi:hypothetical protein